MTTHSIGSGANYSTIAAWEAATPVNSADEWRGQLSDETFTEQVTISGGGTTAVILESVPGTGFNGLPGNGPLVQDNSGGFFAVVNVQSDGVVVEGFRVGQNGTTGNQLGVRSYGSTTGSVHFKRLLIENVHGPGGSDDGSHLTVFENCVVHGTDASPSPGFGGLDSSDKVINCTIIRGDTQIDSQNGAVLNATAKNCYAAYFGPTSGFADYVFLAAASTHNASHDTSGSVGLQNLDPTLVLQSIASYDYRPVATAALNQAGIGSDADSDIPTVDIAGNPRSPTAPTIGAFEVPPLRMPVNGTTPTDDFNRAALGTDWEQLNLWDGSLSIQNSTAIGGPYSGADASRQNVRWVKRTVTKNQYAKLTISGLAFQSNQVGMGVMVRAGAGTKTGPSDDTRSYYEFVVLCDTPGPLYTTVLGKVVNGVFTSLFSMQQAWVDGDNLALEVVTIGSTALLRCYRNDIGLPLFTFTDDSPITDGAPGVSGAGSTVIVGDDFETGNVLGDGVFTWGALRNANADGPLDPAGTFFCGGDYNGGAATLKEVYCYLNLRTAGGHFRIGVRQGGVIGDPTGAKLIWDSGELSSDLPGAPPAWYAIGADLGSTISGDIVDGEPLWLYIKSGDEIQIFAQLQADAGDLTAHTEQDTTEGSDPSVAFAPTAADAGSGGFNDGLKFYFDVAPAAGGGGTTTPVSNTFVFQYGVLQGLSVTNVYSIESLQNAVQQCIATIEALSTSTKVFEDVIESLVSISDQIQASFETLQPTAGATTIPFEALGQAAIMQSIVLALEALAAVENASLPALEALAAIKTQVQLEVEANTTVIQGRFVLLEALKSLSQSRSAEVESLAPVSTDVKPSLESLQSLLHIISASYETIEGLVHSTTVPFEALGQTLTENTFVVPFEARGHVVVSPIASFESLRQAENAHTVTVEALVSASGPVNLEIEALTVAKASHAPYIEAVALLSASSTAEFEFLSGTIGTATLSTEVLGAIAKAADVPFEALLNPSAVLISNLVERTLYFRLMLNRDVMFSQVVNREVEF